MDITLHLTPEFPDLTHNPHSLSDLTTFLADSMETALRAFHHDHQLNFTVNRTAMDEILTDIPAPDVTAQWKMVKPGHSQRESLSRYLGHRSAAPIKMPSNQMHRYTAMQPLLEEILGEPVPTEGVNWGRFLTEVGAALESGVPVSVLRPQWQGEAQNVYRWKSLSPVPYRTVTRDQLESQPAMWWTTPQFVKFSTQTDIPFTLWVTRWFSQVFGLSR
jgi:hypothetical protein